MSQSSFKKTDLPLRSPVVWLMIAFGGGMGAFLRFSWSSLFRMSQPGFPWAVFSENIIGAFLLGWLLAIFVRRRGTHRYARAFFGTGLVGSFTTFSGITADLADYSQSGDILLLFFYPAVSMIAGLAAAFAGLRAGRTTRLIRKKINRNDSPNHRTIRK